ncbi:hypothetical protein TRFO_25523 [Tritrichomonas foetus]|uniref:Uncharacterized protein n=1 Tax=Tritrichomonas foetus TaxID=1144522 RepID=A0A1J4K4X0_9EUKA|nr:hypothetical protein TRFO_25523 [Tritrichomonas foetus]|eukprot:OHT06489.1 hypothetical protein TRFO_25523 [Tritrichomonas foetus]
MPKLLFYLDLEQQNQNVFIVIDGISQPYQMQSIHKVRHFYFFNLALNDENGYPISINYKYINQNGSLIGSQQQRFISLNYKPLNNVIIRDLISFQELKPTISVYFFLEVPFEATNVFITSPFPQLSNQIKIEMKKESSGIWVAMINFDASMPIPLIYSYCAQAPISNHNNNFNYNFILENRCRHMSFNSPLFRHQNVSIYDYFYQQKLTIPFYIPPIDTSSSGDAALADLSFHYSTETEFQSVAVNLNNSLIQFQKYYYWTGNSKILSNFQKTPFTFQNVTCYNQICNFSSPLFTLRHLNNVDFQNVSVHIFKNPIGYYPLTLYFPLVSLKPKKSDKCGSFSSIGDFSLLLCKIGISQLHIHIEKLPGSEMLLDPVQLSLKINCNQNLTLAEIREKKREIIQQLYKTNIINSNLESSYKISFENFKKTFYSFLANSISNDFEFFIQFLCYSELCLNAQIANKNGVQIITDVSVLDGWKIVINSLPVASLYSSAIFLNDISSVHLSGFTIADIKKKFCDNAKLICSTFCTKNGPYYNIKKKYLNNDNLKRDLIFIDSSLREYYYQELIGLREMEQISPQVQEEGIVFQKIIETTKFLSASVIVDENTTNKTGALNVQTMNIIPSSSKMAQNARIYLTPKELTPTRTSEYLSNVQKSQIFKDIKMKMKMNAINIVIYLNDILFCCGISKPVDHQSITGNDPERRDILLKSIEELSSNPNFVQNMIAFLKSLST